MMLSIAALVEKYRANRRLLLLIVYVALFLDNMLLTTVVPIIPEYLLRISHPNSTDMLLHDKMPAKASRLQQRLAPFSSTTVPSQTLLGDEVDDEGGYGPKKKKPPRRYRRASGRRNNKQGNAPVSWDSEEWWEEPGDESGGGGPVGKSKAAQFGRRRPAADGKSSSARLVGANKGGRRAQMRPATTTPHPYEPSDSYEALPDEFSIGFGENNAQVASMADAMMNKGDQSGGGRLRLQSPADEDMDDNDDDGEEDEESLELSEEQERLRHETLEEENVYVGLMFGSKALIQLIANPLVGPLTNKIGYTLPMFFGFVVVFLSTLLFAFGSAFGTLWLARALQGVGSACTSTSGMGMLAQAYPDDAERGSAMGIALGGLALGVLVGPPYGGLFYEWAGKELPFILLALLALGDGTLQFLFLQPKVDRGEPEGTAIKELATDPYIVVAAGSITIGNLGIAMLEPSLPLWMMESWGAGSFERGAAFLPASISYLIGTNIFGPLAHKIGRWLSGFIGLIVIGFCLLTIPSARSVGGLIIPNFCMGFSIGMIDASMFPMMGYIVDVRHVGVYGSIYAIADAAFCFAFALGPFFSGPLVRAVGFPTMMYLIAMINFLYAPLMFFLRRLPDNSSAAVPASTNDMLSSGNGVLSTTVDGNPMHYERIDGVVRPKIDNTASGASTTTFVQPLSNNSASITSATNYTYNINNNINSVWDE